MTLVVPTRQGMDAWLADHRAAGARVGVVMTMGALHDGHLELLRTARKSCDRLVATIFVNPLQFGPNEDFDRYPRTLEADLNVCEEAGVDAVFVPDVAEVYPGGEPMVRVTPGAMGEVLEGEFRPGFFTGVLTVVSKLLNLTRPDVAFFGEKDAQQLACIRRMVLDLNMPIDIVGVPTVREADGLALSSRNRYLSAEEHLAALSLSRALFAGRDAVADGPDAVRKAAGAILDKAAQAYSRPAGASGALADPRTSDPAGPPIALDYLALVNPLNFTEVHADHHGPAVLALAAKVGTTRLIDNLPLIFP